MATAHTPIDSDADSTVSLSGTRAAGERRSVGSIRIYRGFEGVIDAERTVLIGEAARVDGEIRADTVIVFGTVKGRICARAVVIERGARVHADIHYRRISVAPGAEVIGRFTLQGEAASVTYLSSRRADRPDDRTLLLGHGRRAFDRTGTDPS